MKVSKSAIFLFELMFVILVFTISSAICANIFAKAYNFSTDSRDLTNAVIRAESAAEIFKADSDSGASEEAIVYYDAEWRELDTEGGAYYALKLTPVIDGNLCIANVTVTKLKGNEKEIFSLDAVKYVKAF
jgi:hypothetical protein